MSLGTEIDILGAQVKQIKDQRARVEYAREAAQKDQADSLRELQAQFGVDSLEAAETLASSLETELVSKVQQAREALGRLGDV